MTELVLDANGLPGNIPSELTSLDKLVRLNLSLNELTGEIPSELSDLNSLEFLGTPW